MSIYSLSKSLKCDTHQDVVFILDEISKLFLSEIHLSGNTFGVEACQAIAKGLKDQQDLKVFFLSFDPIFLDHWIL
jgi:Ran GTPase-activating protein 1